MKNLVPKSAYGVFIDDKGRIMVDSRCFAKAFERPHEHLRRAIADPLSEFFMSDEFKRQNYEPVNDPDTHEVYFNMTKDGFMALAYAWRTPSIQKATRLERLMEEYRGQFFAFSQLSNCIAYVAADFPISVDGYCKANAYSELHMVPNRLIYDLLRVSESEFRKSRGIKGKGTLTAALTEEEYDMLVRLQAMDVGMLLAGVERRSRDSKLKEYVDMTKGSVSYELVHGVIKKKK